VRTELKREKLVSVGADVVLDRVDVATPRLKLINARAKDRLTDHTLDLEMVQR
jgi:hypothetical protein